MKEMPLIKAITNSQQAGVPVHTWTPSTKNQTQEDHPRVQDQPRLHREFQVNQGYIKNHVSKANQLIKINTGNMTLEIKRLLQCN